MKKFIAFGIVVLAHLSTLDQVNGQSSNITLGDQIGPVIYNGTIDIPAATRPWYQSMLGFFTRSPSPVQNVTYTFPPNNTVSCFFRFESFFKFNFSKLWINSRNTTVRVVWSPHSTWVMSTQEVWCVLLVVVFIKVTFRLILHRKKANQCVLSSKSVDSVLQMLSMFNHHMQQIRKQSQFITPNHMDGSILAMNHRYTITPQIIHGCKTPHLHQQIQHGGTFGSKIEQINFNYDSVMFIVNKLFASVINLTW